MREVVFTENAPAAIGPYSQAIKIQGLVYTSGQVPVNPKTGKIESEDVEVQAKQAMENVKGVLLAAGSDLTKVVKCTIFLKDLEDFGKVNEIYGSYFEKEPPARSCVEVARLPLDCKVEIEAIALA